MCADDIVQTEGLGLDLISDGVRDARRRDLVHFAFVLRVVIEELIMCHHLRDGESDGFVLRLIGAAGHFGTLHERFADHLVALLESSLDGRIDVFHRLHFGAAEGRTAYVRFDEAGQAQRVRYLRCVRQFLPRTQHHTVCDMKTEIGQVVVAGIFVKRQRRGEDTAAGVGHSDHIEVTLQDTVLARRTVDGDIRQIEGVLRAPARKRKIILIDGASVLGVPILSFEHDDSHVVPRLADPGLQPGSRPQRHVVLAAVSPRNDSYFSFHVALFLLHRH